jgi:hypothetical protein
MIDTYQDLQYTLSEELCQKSRYLQRLQKQNARFQQENAALHVLHLETKLAAAAPKTMIVNDIHDQKLHLPLCCPISLEIFKDPVFSTQTGLSFERVDIEKWLMTNHVCPCTRAYMTSVHLMPNYTLKGVCDAFRAQQK